MRLTARPTLCLFSVARSLCSMDDASSKPSPEPTSEKKTKANRRNALKSTGPRTARGKSWSRLNALKHGILASQAVITVTEGRAQRKAFEEMVDGFTADF